MIPRRVDLNQNQLFLDDRWIEETQRLSRLWHRAEIYPEPVVRPDEAWEGSSLLMTGTVIKVGETLKMYYLSRGTSTVPGCFCVAESEDGLHWRKPRLGPDRGGWQQREQHSLHHALQVSVHLLRTGGLRRALQALLSRSEQQGRSRPLRCG